MKVTALILSISLSPAIHFAADQRLSLPSSPSGAHYSVCVFLCLFICFLQEMKKVISDAVSVGVPTYNAGKIEDCVRIYKSVTRQLLSDHRRSLSDEAVQKLEEALTKSQTAQTAQDMNSSAWTLRKALDFAYDLPEATSAESQSTSTQSISDCISEAIETGVPLFNKGKIKECVLIYGKLAQTLHTNYDTVLSPEALEKLREAFEFCEQNMYSSVAAWKLRNALDFVYNQQKGVERFIMNLGTQRTLLDFSGITQSALKFSPVCINDTVMGGSSRSVFIVGPDYGKFSGYVTTERNGGFASMKLVPQDPRLLKAVLKDSSSLELSVKNLEGENFRFKLQVSTERVTNGITWQSDFDLSVSSDFATIHAPFSTFSPTQRGRVVGKRGQLNPVQIESIGLMLSKLNDDGTVNNSFKIGPFALAIRWIRAVK